MPQGSHLGPLLFIIFINDITLLCMFSLLLLFADGIKLFLKLTALSDCQKLQADLVNLFHWSLMNDLPFNVEKCSFITFSRSSLITEYDYVLDGTFLQRVKLIKDLGILHEI